MFWRLSKFGLPSFSEQTLPFDSLSCSEMEILNSNRQKSRKTGMHFTPYHIQWPNSFQVLSTLLPALYLKERILSSLNSHEAQTSVAHVGGGSVTGVKSPDRTPRPLKIIADLSDKERK